MATEGRVYKKKIVPESKIEFLTNQKKKKEREIERDGGKFEKFPVKKNKFLIFLYVVEYSKIWTGVLRSSIPDNVSDSHTGLP